MRIALVHEKFTVYAGSERVVEQLHLLWPDAPIFTTVCDPETLGPILRDADVRTSPLQKLYRGGDHYAHLLPLLPVAMRHLDLSGYDLVITSHHAFADRVRPRPDTPIVAYVHTPARWIWEAETRRHEIGGAAGRVARRVRRDPTGTRPARRARHRPRRELALRRRPDSPVVGTRVDGRRAAGRHRVLHTRCPGFGPARRLLPRRGTARSVQAPRARGRRRRERGVKLVVAGDGRAGPPSRRPPDRPSRSSAGSTTRPCATSTATAVRCSFPARRTSGSCRSRPRPAGRR